MQTRKKVLSILLTLCMLLGMIPTFAMAADATVTSEATLKAAITQANTNDTITLDGSFQITSQIVVDKAITIDGNGKTITANNTSWANTDPEKYMLVVTADATVKDLTLDGNSQARGGLQFYCVDSGKVADFTATKCNEIGLMVNASTVTATGKLNLTGCGWGSIVNVSYGQNITTPKNTSLDASGVTETNVTAFYADAGDLSRAKAAEKAIAITAPADWDAVNTLDSETTPTTGLKGFVPAVAQVGTINYATLEDAVAAVAQNGTVNLLKDCSGSGIGTFVNATGGKIGVKNFTIDFGGHTYTCTGPAVGSPNTENQAFHLEKGANVTLKNGTINTVSGSGVAMLVQNYCNLTLEDVTLDGTNISDSYTMSNNCGTVKITGKTNIKAPSGGYAFDACWAPNKGYPEGTQVTLNTTGEITGNIQFDLWGSNVTTACLTTLAIQNCNMKGSIVIDSNIAAAAPTNISITGGTFSTDPSTYVAAGYVAVAASDTFVIKTVQDALTPTVDVAQSGGVTLTGDTFSGNVDTRTFTVTDADIHTGYSSILVPVTTGANETGPWKLKDSKELTFATIKFANLVDNTYYTVQQTNPALHYAYEDAFSDNVKIKTYLGSDLKGGLCFPISSQPGDITFKIAVASGEGATADLTTATATYTFKNEVTFEASSAPAESAPVVEVAPSVSGTTASATVPDTAISGAVNNVAPSTTVEIVATTTNNNVTTAQVTLGKDAVAALVDDSTNAKVAAVDIKTDVGTVTLSDSAIETIAADSNVKGSGATVEVKAATVVGAVAAVEVTVKSGNNAVAIKDLAQPITISFNIGTGKVNPVLLYDDDGTLKNISSSKYDPETGIITGTTSHLTKFVAVDPMTTVPGGIGQKVTLTPNSTSDYLTIQVTYGGANSIYTVKAAAAVEIYVANGTVLNVWETTAVPTFDKGSFAPNSNPTILVNNATISAS